MKRKPKAPKASDRTATKDRLMKRARELAQTGLYQSFKDVTEKIMAEDPKGLTLRLWATASDQFEIDKLCKNAREPIIKRARRGK